MKRGHLPLRTCRACGRKAGQNELIRWTVRRGEIIEDSNRDMQGRGVYCCPAQECRARLLNNKKKLKTALRLQG